MPKYKHTEGNYCQVWKAGVKKLNECNKSLPYSTRWLYIHLHLLEHQYYDSKIDGFFRSIQNLATDMQMGRRQVIEGIQRLEKLGLVKTWQMHWIDLETKKQSRKHITAFRILEP